jgi:thiol-disulfide isomerase/thioredoxin
MVLSLSGCGRRPAETEGLEVGSPAPSFKLPDLNGKEVALSQFKGKVVLLDFWATWCGPCRMTMPVMEKLEREFPREMVLLAINLQEPKDMVRDYVREQSLSSRVLLDEEGSVGEAYGTGAIPMQVLIDKEGIIRDILVGFNERMASKLRSEIETLR